MNSLTLVLKNLTRNKIRSGLTILAVALPMAMFVMVSAIRDVFDGAFRNASKELRLAVHHRASIMYSLPERVRGVIHDADPEGKVVLAACGMRFFGGKVQGLPPFEFPSIAVDADGFPQVFSEYGLPTDAEALKDWNAYKNACVVGVATCEHYGWKRGQEIELRSELPPYPTLRFRIVYVSRTGANPSVHWCRRDFVDDAIKTMRDVKVDTGLVNMIWIKCRDASQMAPLAAKIDAATANTPDETKTEDESTFIAGFIKALGDLPGKVAIISYVVVAAIVMVVANTMSLAFRERSRELAAFKALGFHNFWILRMVMAESLALAVIGGLIGIVPTYLATQIYPITNLGFGPMKRFIIPASSAMTGFVAVLIVGILAGLLPAVQAVKLKVVDALRKIA
jgi:putative ABC transport system permease protein